MGSPQGSPSGNGGWLAAARAGAFIPDGVTSPASTSWRWGMRYRRVWLSFTVGADMKTCRAICREHSTKLMPLLAQVRAVVETVLPSGAWV